MAAANATPPLLIIIIINYRLSYQVRPFAPVIYARAAEVSSDGRLISTDPAELG